jgi:hypothetical protein
MKYIKHLLVLAVSLVMITACSNDPEIVVKTTNATINLLDPSESVKISEFTDVTISFTELNTQEVIEQKVTSNSLMLDLNQGSYEVSVNGKVKYSVGGVSQEGTIGAFVNELNLIYDVQNEGVQLSLKAFSKDFILEEIFFTGNKTPDGSFYYGDQYFKIYNNTDEVLYADGLILAQSKFQTVDKLNQLAPDIMTEAFATKAMVQIPGSGTEHPVEPGKSLIIALDGINHLELNTNSIDLSTADFEIQQLAGDVDNPAVPNAIKLVEDIVPHNRGFESWVLARFPEGTKKESYLADYKYDYSWLFVFGSFELPQNESEYKIPNEWVVDAVNLSVESEFQWVVTDPSLDSGWTYCGKTDGDGSRFGKSVKRKVLQEVDGVRLLQDTNNSTIDFEPEATPTLK